MTDRSLDELGPVDYLIVEFPAGAQNFTGEGAAELVRLHDAGTIRIMDLLILAKSEDGSVEARELSDLPELGELERIEAQLAQTLAEDDVATSGGCHGSGQRRRRAHLREPVGGTVRIGHASCGWAVDRQRAHPDPSHHRRRRSRRSARTSRSLICRSEEVVSEGSGSSAPLSPKRRSWVRLSHPADHPSPRRPSLARRSRPADHRSRRLQSSAQLSRLVVAVASRYSDRGERSRIVRAHPAVVDLTISGRMSGRAANARKLEGEEARGA